MEDLDTFSSLLSNCPQLIFHTVSANGSDACMCLVQNRVKRLKSAISYSPPFLLRTACGATPKYDLKHLLK